MDRHATPVSAQNDRAIGWLAFVACMVVVLSGCGGEGPTAPGPVLTVDLTTAPTRIALAGKILTLATSLWRDFQPISPPDGKPLVALLQVRTEDGSAVPATVRADTVWVIFGTETWSGVPQEEHSRVETTPVYEIVARDGPRWGPGVAVDVVVRLRDASGRGFLLRATNQLIRGTF
jgi:hypothetical protein